MDGPVCHVCLTPLTYHEGGVECAEAAPVVTDLVKRPRTRPQPRQSATAECPQCRSLFEPRRPTQTFCGQKCRSDYHRDRGIEGQVVSVRRISRGVSLVIHVAGPSAEAALRLQLRQVVRVVP